jgi:Aromatic-ring hydroxylase, C-terminal
LICRPEWRERLATALAADGRWLLVRPEAVIAWVGEDSSSDALREALQRWLGAPIVSSG